MTIGQRIKTLRELRGLSQQQLANAAGLETHSSISMLENGHYDNPTLRTIENIAKALNVTTATLFNQHVDYNLSIQGDVLPLNPLEDWSYGD